MVVRREVFPVGNAGSKYSIREVARLAREQYGSPEHHAVTKAWVAHCLREAGSPHTIPERLDAILKAIWAETVYFPDPVYIESIQAPHITLSGLVPGGDCFAEGTLMLAEGHETVAVEDLREGMKIWGFDRWSTIERTAFKGVLPIDAVHLNNGSTLKLTGDHHVYVLDCRKHPTLSEGNDPVALPPDKHWRKPDGQRCQCDGRVEKRTRVSELRPGMVLPCPDKIPFGKESQHLGRAWIEGVFVADGWAEPGRFGISGQDGCPKEEQKRKVASICADLGIPTKTSRKFIRVKDPEWALRVTSMGHRAFNKHLLSIDLDEATARVTLDGVMVDAGNNTLGTGRTFTTTSRALAIQTRLLHRMFGISCGYRYIEDHGGLGEHGIHRLGTRPALVDRAPWLLRVREIDRNIAKVPCWDIQTDDHRVYLAEHDVTVSQCDDLAAAFLGAIGCAGIHGVSVGHAFPERDSEGNDLSRVIAHVLAAAWEPRPTPQNPRAGKWWYADASVKNQPLGTYARKPSWEYVIDVPTGETLCEKDSCLMPGSNTLPTMLTGPGAYLGVSGVPPEVLFESPIEEDNVVLDFAPIAEDLGVSAGAPTDPVPAAITPATTAFLAATDEAWVKYFQYEADSLLVSWNRALGSYSALRKMAEDLSLPFPDPPAAEQAMLRTGWTADDDQIIVQLSGLVDVTARALLDVALGKRKIFPLNAATGMPDPQGTDIGVELLPGDAAKVGYPPGAAPAPEGAPQYMPALVDPKAAPSPSSGALGTGSVWLVGGTLTAGAVTTLELAANIRAICETAVSISSNARATTLAKAEAILAASGTATPAQSSAMVKAVSDSIVKETGGKEEAPAKTGMPLWQKGLLLGGLALLLFLGVKAIMKHLEEKKAGGAKKISVRQVSSRSSPKQKHVGGRHVRQLTA